MKVAIVHDDLVQLGGAERVLEGISEIFPDAPIFTSVFDSSNKELFRRFGSKKIRTSFLQNIPLWRKLYKVLLPLYPLAFEQFDFFEFDLVISNTTRFAKSVITHPKTTHVCYCHTPPRFLWNFPSDSYPAYLDSLFSFMRIFDRVSSTRVDFFIAGSSNTKRRIEKVYKAKSKIVYPFVDLKRFKNIEVFEGDYFLVIARLNRYKKIDLVLKACAELNVPLKIVGDGPELNKLQVMVNSLQINNIDFLGNLSDEMVLKLLAGCKALIIPGNEDFGLTPLEAQVLGKPVVAYAGGGVLETVIPGETGLFFRKQEVESIKEGMIKLDSIKINPEKCKENARHFSKENFIKNFREAVREFAFF